MTPFFGGAKSSAFFRLSAKLKLVPKDRESIDLKDPTSMSYIFRYAKIEAVWSLCTEFFCNNNNSNNNNDDDEDDNDNDNDDDDKDS